jgi:D-alanyl-D-alanine carboxypeptidase
MKRLIVLMIAVVALVAGFGSVAQAKYASIVVNETTGEVMYSRNADKQLYPASLTKIMTLYMLFEALDNGQVRMNTKMKVSKLAASRSPSKLGLKPGSYITVENAIMSLITKSANDVATVVSEHLAKSERAFAKKMTRKARALGMSRTTFRNASGLPHSQQKSTARDMANLPLPSGAIFPITSISSKRNPLNIMGAASKTTTPSSAVILARMASKLAISMPLVLIWWLPWNAAASAL